MHTAEHDVEVTWEFSIFVVEIRFVCNNHAFQWSLVFHLTIIISTGEFFLFFSKIELLVLPQKWLASWSCLCLCWHNAVVNSRVESILQLNLSQGISMSLFGQHLLLYIALLSSAFSCWNAFRRSNCSGWIMSWRLIPLVVSQVEGF